MKRVQSNLRSGRLAEGLGMDSGNPAQHCENSLRGSEPLPNEEKKKPVDGLGEEVHRLLPNRFGVHTFRCAMVSQFA